MASSHSAYFSSRAVPCEAYASSELSLKSVAVMSLEQLCGALSNIINEPLWRPTIVVGLFLCYPTLISQGCWVVGGSGPPATCSALWFSKSSPRGERAERRKTSDFLKESPSPIFLLSFWYQHVGKTNPHPRTLIWNKTIAAFHLHVLLGPNTKSNSKRNKTKTKRCYQPGDKADVICILGVFQITY